MAQSLLLFTEMGEIICLIFHIQVSDLFLQLFKYVNVRHWKGSGIHNTIRAIIQLLDNLRMKGQYSCLSIVLNLQELWFTPNVICINIENKIFDFSFTGKQFVSATLQVCQCLQLERVQYLQNKYLSYDLFLQNLRKQRNQYF